MKKEFVPYELAVKLKELGFDEDCLGYYYDKNFVTILHRLDKEVVKAPTFSQCFRWFREKHNLNAISPTLLMYTTNVWAFRIIDLGISEDVIGCRTANSHEEAELACLDKLIEIVESKSE